MEPVRSETGFRSETDRCGEIAMTDEAHAKSSLVRSASAHGERDYEAIRDALTATARGRWFLAEFAKRNRNAEIRMVLDAVARIEQSRRPEKETPADPAGIVAAVGDAIAKARQRVDTALQAPPSAERLAVAYRSLRAIREIAWTLRQSGPETGLCDRLDAHANAIDRSLDHLAPGDAVAPILDDLIRGLEAIAGGAAAPSFPDETAIAEAEEAHDLAVLDMVAMEMGAPAADDDNDAAAIDAAAMDAGATAHPDTPDAARDHHNETPASLGAAVLASGALPPGAGRFAAIQRLSQAEKVALFS